MNKLLLTAAIILISGALAQAQQRPYGCNTFGTTGIPYAGNPIEDCVNHDDHFRQMTTADWESLSKGEIELKAKNAAYYLAALEYMAKLRALRMQIDARIQ